MGREMGKVLRVGFIGAGAIARTHMDHLSRIGGVEICAAADISKGSLEIARDKYRIPRVYRDYRQMLRREQDIMAVDICTPNVLHAPNTIAALRAGKHVMVEKPMAMNVKEAQAMLTAAKKAKRRLIVGFQFRFDPRTKVIRDQIESGSFGKILYVRAQWLRRRGIPNWGVFGQKKLQGGGPMIDIGVHVLETAHYMIGAPKPISVTGNTWAFHGNKPSAVASQWPGWDYKTYDVEDLAVGMVRFATGTMLTVETSFVAHIEKDIWNIQVIGEHGGAVWDNVQIFADHGGYMMNMTPAFVPKADYWDYKMRHFVEVCRDGRKNESPGEHGLMIQQILDGVYESAKKGRAISIR
jgi:predicted dehydrogenase